MRIGKKTYEQIDGYLEGKLSNEEEAAFKNQIVANKELAAEVQAYAAVNELIVDSELIALKARLNAKYRRGKSNPRNNYYRYLYIPGIVLLTSLAVYMWRLNPSPTSVASTNDPQSPKEIQVQKHIATVEKKDSAGAAQIYPPVAAQHPDVPLKKEKTDSSQYISKNQALQDQERDAISDSAAKIVETTNDSSNQETMIPIKEIKGISSAAIETPGNIRLETAEEDASSGTKERQPCEFNFGLLSIKTTASCSEKPEGNIHLEWVQEQAEGFYQFSIDPANFQSSLRFDGLYPGVYYLQVKDKDGCVAENVETVVVREQSCEVAYQNAFSPMRGETWNIPIETSQSGTLNIFDRSGALVLSLVIHKGQPSLWDGRDRRGVTLPMGSYTFMIIDNNKIYKKGQVTIIK